MTTRWDVERAAFDTPMLPNRRYVLLVLATRCDHQTAVIPPRFSPSLTDLVRMTGLARSTVAVHLNGLERDGWVIRKRPNPEEARRNHARTQYRLTVPKLVRSSDEAGPANGSDLVRSSAKAGPATGRKDNRRPEPTRARTRAPEDEVIETIIETLREVTGKTITREFAERNARRIREAADRPVHSTTYYATVIRNDPTPYLPTPEPPRFRAPARS